MQSVAELLEPLYLKLRERVMSSDYIQMDESIIPVVDKDKPGGYEERVSLGSALTRTQITILPLRQRLQSEVCSGRYSQRF